MTKDQYVQNCMDAWMVGWDGAPKDKSAEAQAVVATNCLEAFQEKFPESEVVTDQSRRSRS